MPIDNLHIIAEINKQLADLDIQIEQEELVSKTVELMAKKRNLQELQKIELEKHESK